MNKVITFIIPVRHYENASNWNETISNLTQTLQSITAQIRSNWQCTIVVNQGSKLPIIPEGIDVCYVDFPPNKLHRQGSNDKETFYEAIRLDKGKRVLAGLIKSEESEYVMVVDDDDFIHAELTTFIENNNGQSGWYITDGYLWGDKGRWLKKHSNFEELCGTSFILRRKFLSIPNSVTEADKEYVKKMFGSHKSFKQEFQLLGQPLLPIPFPAAIYRIGHSDAHSASAGFFERIFLNKHIISNPRGFIKDVLSIRFLSSHFKRKFFGYK